MQYHSSTLKRNGTRMESLHHEKALIHVSVGHSKHILETLGFLRAKLKLFLDKTATNLYLSRAFAFVCKNDNFKNKLMKVQPLNKN